MAKEFLSSRVANPNVGPMVLRRRNRLLPQFEPREVVPPQRDFIFPATVMTRRFVGPMVQRVGRQFYLSPYVRSSAASQQTLIAREDFTGTGNIELATPGGFSAVPTGSMLKHRVGYYTGSGSSPGRCGVVKDEDMEAYFTRSISGGAVAAIECTVRFRDFGVCTATTLTSFMRALSSTFAETILIGVQADGHVAVLDTQQGLLQLGEVLSLNTWYTFVLAVQQNSNNSTTYQLWRKVADQPLNLIYDRGPAAFFGVTSLERLQVCNKYFGVVSHWKGHLSVTALYTESKFEDVIFPSDLTEPPLGPFDWYMTWAGSVTGSGSLSDPWYMDITFLNNEFAYGLFTQANGYASGDTVYIDTHDGDLDTHASTAPAISLTIGCRGINVKPISGQTYWKVRTWRGASGPFVQDATYSNLWKYFPIGSDNINGSCIWENDVNPSKMKRSDYASEALVLAAMAAKPSGEFWWYPNVAGTIVYIKASGDGNPNSNGKTYDVASNINGTGDPAVLVTAFDVNIEGLYVIKTCLAISDSNASLDGDPLDGTCLSFTAGSGGTSRVASCSFDKWSKHAYKEVHSASNTTLIDSNNLLGNGSCYCIFGGQSGIAWFNGSDTASGNVVVSTSLSQVTNAMLPQSTGGTISLNYASVLLHNASVIGTQFSSVTITSATLAGNINENQAAAVLNIDRTVFAGGQTRAGVSNLTSSRTTNYPFLTPVANKSVLALNSAFTIIGTLSSANTNHQVQGTNSYIGCSFDARQAFAGDANASLFYRTGTAVLILGDCAFAFGGKDIAIAADFLVGEITADYNGYEKLISARLYDNYGGSDQTGTAWQALGQDTNAVWNTSLGISANTFYLATESPLRGVGDILSFPTLASTRDLYQAQRTAAGATDMGAALFNALFVGGAGMFKGIIGSGIY